MTRELLANLVHKYSDAVVHRDRDRWASCWAEDAKWELAADRVVKGRSAIVEHWLQSMETIDVVVQMVGNGRVTIDGETAKGRWYFQEHVRRRDGDVGILLAYYDDTYVFVGGRWLFTSRRLTRMYHGPPDLSAPFELPPTDA